MNMLDCTFCGNLVPEPDAKWVSMIEENHGTRYDLPVSALVNDDLNVNVPAHRECVVAAGIF